MPEFRRHELKDIDKMVSILEKHLKDTTYRNVAFSKEKMTDVLRGNLNNIQFFSILAIEDEEIIGGMTAVISSPYFSYEAFANDLFLYIIPEKRSLKLATALVAKYVEWAKARKVKRIQLANSMGVNVEGFAKLAKRLGFEQTGTIHVMEI